MFASTPTTDASAARDEQLGRPISDCLSSCPTTAVRCVKMLWATPQLRRSARPSAHRARMRAPVRGAKRWLVVGRRRSTRARATPALARKALTTVSILFKHRSDALSPVRAAAPPPPPTDDDPSCVAGAHRRCCSLTTPLFVASTFARCPSAATHTNTHAARPLIVAAFRQFVQSKARSRKTSEPPPLCAAVPYTTISCVVRAAQRVFVLRLIARRRCRCRLFAQGPFTSTCDWPTALVCASCRH